MKFPILSLMTFIPLLGMFVILFVPKENHKTIKTIAIIASGLPLLLAIILYLRFNPNITDPQFVERSWWIKSIGARYYMGVDGLSIILALVTPLLTFIAILSSWNLNFRPKEYFGLMLLLEVGMVGVFFALDFILFYVFWELVLLPMYFLIGIWGGPRKEYAAIKFFLFTLLGSIFMLLGILAIYFASGVKTFDMLELARANLPVGIQKLAFLGMFLGFAVKVPMVPLHTWLPDAHVEAPTAVSVLLAGVLLKMGTYGFVRVGLGVVPSGMRAYIYAIAVLGVIGIIYGALNAMVQSEIGRAHV